MQNSIKIGPIQKGRPTPQRHSLIKERLTKMKVGNFFEISGFSQKSEILNIRASIGYFSKKENVKVSTSVKNGVLRVEKIKSIKTKEVSKVK
jgi:hypothetical protein